VSPKVYEPVFILLVSKVNPGEAVGQTSTIVIANAESIDSLWKKKQLAVIISAMWKLS
jgi:hypothetical protein